MRRWVAAAALVTIGWLASPGAVPVYDGVGSPDEPYKRVGTSSAPVAVSTKVPVSAALQLRSDENGPQVLLDLATGSFAGPGTSMTLTATPLASDGTPPRGTFDGNTYRISATPGVTLRSEKAQGFLFLRAAVMTKPAPVMVHRRNPSDPWVEVKTNVSGRDVLTTPFRDLGDYAVVRLPGAEPLSSGGLSFGRLLLLGTGVLALLTITVIVLRRPRTDDP